MLTRSIVGISRISASEARRMANKTLPIPDDNDHYIISLSVFHQLHCLVRADSCRPSPKYWSVCGRIASGWPYTKASTGQTRMTVRELHTSIIVLMPSGKVSWWVDHSRRMTIKAADTKKAVLSRRYATNVWSRQSRCQSERSHGSGS